jgi:lipopolysaccharide heptosyltransferase II
LKILILKPSSLGDVIQALPVLRLLKLRFPDAAIHWWLDSNLVPLLADDPDLDGIVPFNRHGWGRPANLVKRFAELQAVREQSFDWIIDLQGLARSGLFAWLSRGKLCVGFDDSREGARGFYDFCVPGARLSAHAVDCYLKILRALDVPVHWNFEWLPPKPRAAEDVRRKWPVGAQRWVALLPGARWPNKRWPAGHFAGLAGKLAAAHPDLRFAALGTQADHDAGELIARSAPGRALNLTGKTSLPEMIEWVRLSDLIISNDTGPLHVAAALGKPVVAIFGPTDPRRTGPYGCQDGILQSRIPCVPCLSDRCANPLHLECLRLVTPELAFASANAALHAKGKRLEARG